MSKLLTTKQLEDLLKIDRITVYRMLNDGRLKGIKVGNQWRFSQSEIDRLLGREKVEKEKAAESIPDFPANCTKEIQDIFAGIIGIGAVTVTLKGTPLTSVTFSNPFCKMMLSSESGREACQASWRRIAEKATGEPKFQTCHAGLTYKRSLIENCGSPIAWLIAGQYFLNSRDHQIDKEKIRELARKHDIPYEQLLEAAEKIPVLKQSQQDLVQSWTPKVALTFQSIICERTDFVNRLQQIAELSSITNTLSQ